MCTHPSFWFYSAALSSAHFSSSNLHSANSFPTLSTSRGCGPKIHSLPPGNLWAHLSPGGTFPTACLLNLEECHACVCSCIYTCFTRTLQGGFDTPNLLPSKVSLPRGMLVTHPTYHMHTHYQVKLPNYTLRRERLFPAITQSVQLYFLMTIVQYAVSSSLFSCFQAVSQALSGA